MTNRSIFVFVAVICFGMFIAMIHISPPSGEGLFNDLMCLAWVLMLVALLMTSAIGAAMAVIPDSPKEVRKP